MARWSRYAGNYSKDNSPKAREILRLIEMFLDNCSVKSDSTGVPRHVIIGPLWIERKRERSTIDSFELWTHYTYRGCGFPGHTHTPEPHKSKMLLKAIKHLEPNWDGSQRSHIVFYAKRDSEWMLHELHKLLPLEALAYYGGKP